MVHNLIDKAVSYLIKENHMLIKLNDKIRAAKTTINNQEGKVGWALLWLLGVPIPVLLILFVLRGCT